MAWYARRPTGTGDHQCIPSSSRCFEEELGGCRPDRLAVSEPQGSLPRGARTLSAPLLCVPRLDEGGVAVDSSALTFLEEEKRTDQLDDLILSGAHVSAADRAARRRWALNPPSLRGGRRKKRKRRKKLPKASSGHGRPCDHATPVPAVLPLENAKVPQIPFIDGLLNFLLRHRDRSLQCKLCRYLEIPRCRRRNDWCWGWSRQCRKWRLHSCSSWTGLWSCPLLCKTRGYVRAVLGQGC